MLRGPALNVEVIAAREVDIGVHRDGLVHVSELTHRWVADPREAVKVGEIVKVKVLEVDYQRERIGLSIKALQQPPAEGRPATGSAGRSGRPDRNAQAPQGGSRPPAKPSPKPQASLEDLMKKFNRPGGR